MPRSRRRGARVRSDTFQARRQVDVAWAPAQQLRSISHLPLGGRPGAGARHAPWLPGCPVPEVAWLGRTLPAGRTEWLASFDIGGAAHRPTEAINLLIEKRHRAAYGVRNVTDHRLRLLLAHGLPRQISPPHSAQTEPATHAWWRRSP